MPPHNSILNLHGSLKQKCGGWVGFIFEGLCEIHAPTLCQLMGWGENAFSKPQIPYSLSFKSWRFEGEALVGCCFVCVKGFSSSFPPYPTASAATRREREKACMLKSRYLYQTSVPLTKLKCCKLFAGTTYCLRALAHIKCCAFEKLYNKTVGRIYFTEGEAPACAGFQ